LWKNLESPDDYNKFVKLKNIESGTIFQDIAANHSSLQLFDSPLILPFQFIGRDGFVRQTCQLTVLSDEGFVNNPELDTSIHLFLNVEYPPTTIETFFLNNNYSMRFYETREDIFSIKNIGVETAKNIHLSGEWFQFTQNDFDLSPGESKNIGYTVDPTISNSSETGIEYTKKILVSGNFQSFEEDFFISIEYAEFVNDEKQNASTLKDYICDNFPEFCEPQIVYRYADAGDAELNVSYTQNQVRALYDLFFDFLDDQAIKDKQLTEFTDGIDSKLSTIENSTSLSKQDIADLNQNLEDSNGAWGATALLIGIIVTCLLLFTIGMRYKEKFRNNIWSRYG